ncbi:hypothetical protein BJV82DRAFT_695995 [Fennellomyces sp. T-0311]|nr:hypothetical protein BJV82DRAFT_695995 [Fennellomyces sp. T-0311]
MEFTDTQTKVLAAIADTIVAPLTEQEEAAISNDGHSTALIQAAELSTYAKYSGSSDITSIINKLRNLPSEKKKLLQDVLDALSTMEGTSVLTGQDKKFVDLTRSEREAILLNWKSSSEPPLVALYKAFTSILLYSIYSRLCCPAYLAMGYEGCDPVRSRPNYQSTNPTKRLPMLSREELLQIPRFDTIIVGSGAGGGVCAAELAAAGQTVLVIEKGRYYHESEFQLNEEAGSKLMDSGGPIASENGNFNPSHATRQKWSEISGISYFTSLQFETDLQRVYDRIGASTSGINRNKQNQYVFEGCRKLGYDVADAPQNTSGLPHECNWCFYGCRDGVKNGTINTWLADAHEHGAKLLDQSEVTQVIIQDGKAIGVDCVVHGNSNSIRIYADRVVVSAGSMRTPSLLLNSGLSNRHIGSNLRIHPGTYVFGVFDEPINMHQGAISSKVADIGSDTLIEPVGIHAGLLHALLPWRGVVHHKQFVLKYRHVMSLFVTVSDNESSGYVKPDDDGGLSFDYILSQCDRERLQIGLDKAVQLLCSVGAREIHTMQLNVEPLVFAKDEEISLDHPCFINWREQVRRHGLPDFGVSMFPSVHPMGSCRLGHSPEVSATAATGETWEVKDLYVADTSLFPLPSGVNPMVTAEAVSLNVARNIIKSTKARAYL